MTVDCTEKTSVELRELARIVLRDRIDAAHLGAYMQDLLARHLIELDATCRCEAMKLCRHCSDLSDLELAGHLYETAVNIERGTASLGGSVSSIGKSRRQVLEIIEPQRRPLLAHRERVSWIPESVAAIAFMAVSIYFLMTDDCGDLALRVMACSIYGLVGVTHALVAIHTAWQNAHAESQATCGA